MARTSTPDVRPSLSDDAKDKLAAALNHAHADTDGDLGAEYREACRAWFAALTPRERTTASAARAAYRRGTVWDAEELARELPPAPKRP